MKAKRKRGRPALGPGKGRESVVVSFRVTRDQYAALEQLAVCYGRTAEQHAAARIREDADVLLRSGWRPKRERERKA